MTNVIHRRSWSEVIAAVRLVGGGWKGGRVEQSRTRHPLRAALSTGGPGSSLAMQSEPGVVRLNSSPSRRPGCLRRHGGLKTDRKSMSHPSARTRIPRENKQNRAPDFPGAGSTEWGGGETSERLSSFTFETNSELVHWCDSAFLK